jgi:sulfatase maturation enzyme AslB (radical SAM superfamily)
MLAEILTINHRALFVEIELTSYCNARCIHCPRDDMRAPQMMTERTFDAILDRYSLYRNQLCAEAGPNARIFPKLYFAGGGEPNLHPRAASFLSSAKTSGFYTKIYSNAARLTSNYAQTLVDSHVDEISISCHGVTPQEVSATMGLKKYDEMIENILFLKRQLNWSHARMYVTYSALDELETSDEEIHGFWSQKGIDCFGPYPVWNRAGQLKKLPTQRRPLFPTRKVSFDHAAWCARLSYFDSIAANGDYVYCGCGFFAKDAPVLGNVHSAPLVAVHAAYQDVLKRKSENAMCRVCFKPSERYLISEILDALEENMNVRF